MILLINLNWVERALIRCDHWEGEGRERGHNSPSLEVGKPLCCISIDGRSLLYLLPSPINSLAFVFTWTSNMEEDEREKEGERGKEGIGPPMEWNDWTAQKVFYSKPRKTRKTRHIIEMVMRGVNYPTVNQTPWIVSFSLFDGWESMEIRESARQRERGRGGQAALTIHHKALEIERERVWRMERVSDTVDQ